MRHLGKVRVKLFETRSTSESPLAHKARKAGPSYDSRFIVLANTHRCVLTRDSCHCPAVRSRPSLMSPQGEETESM